MKVPYTLQYQPPPSSISPIEPWNGNFYNFTREKCTSAPLDMSPYAENAKITRGDNKGGGWYLYFVHGALLREVWDGLDWAIPDCAT